MGYLQNIPLIEQVHIYSYTTYIMVPEISYRHFFLIFGAVVVTVSLDFTAAEGIFGGRFVLGRKWRGSSNPTGYTPLLLFRSNDKESKLTKLGRCWAKFG